MGRAFYKGCDSQQSAWLCFVLLLMSCRGFEPRMTRREAALILQLSYVLFHRTFCFVLFLCRQHS